MKSLRQLSEQLQGAAGSAGELVRGSARNTVESVAQLPAQVSAALPTREGLRNALGNALVTGGKVLIDPRAAIGEMAVRWGESLRTDPDRVRWFVVCADESGAGESFGFHDLAAAQSCLQTVQQLGRGAYLCEVSEHRPAPHE